MATVLDAQFGIADESTYGTAVTPTRFYEVQSGDGFEYRPNRVQGTGMRPSSIGPRSARRVTPNFDYGASMNAEVLSRGFGLLFEKFTGGTPTVNAITGGYQMVFTLGGALKPFTGQLGVPRIGADGSTTIDPFTGKGCTVGSFGFAMSNADILKATYSLDVQDMTTATALATASYASGANLFSFAGFSVYGGTYTAPTTTALATGGTPLANVTDFSIDVTRNADVTRYLAGLSGKHAIPIPGQAGVSGSLGIEYSDTVYRDGYLNDTDLVLVGNFIGAQLSGSTYEAVQICLANIRLEGELPKPSGETTKASCGFTGLENGTNPLLQIVYRTADTAL